MSVHTQINESWRFFLIQILTAVVPTDNIVLISRVLIAHARQPLWHKMAASCFSQKKSATLYKFLTNHINDYADFIRFLNNKLILVSNVQLGTFTSTLSKRNGEECAGVSLGPSERAS